MPSGSDIAFTASVRAAQRRRGSRGAIEKAARRMDWPSQIDDSLAAFIAERDHFYLGTASRAGQPCIQHRGGPKGFLKVLDPRHLAFADFAGNRQYITVGNLDENDHVFLFLIDYVTQRRIKIWGRATSIEDDAELLEKLIDPAYRARAERAIVIEVAAWDVNCRQHIQRRYTVDELRADELLVEPSQR